MKFETFVRRLRKQMFGSESIGDYDTDDLEAGILQFGKAVRRACVDKTKEQKEAWSSSLHWLDDIRGDQCDVIVKAIESIDLTQIEVKDG